MKKTLFLLFFSYISLWGQEGKFGFTIEGGFDFPMDDFNTFYNPSFGGFGGIFYNFSESGRVTATIGYNHWALDLDALNEETRNSGNKGTFNVEAPISAIPLLINVKYFLKNNSIVTPYLLAEGGIYRVTREIYGQYIDENNNSNKITPREENTTDGSFNIGFGIEYPVNEVMNLDISARYHFLLNKDVHNLGDYGYSAEYSTSNFISLVAGLNIFFE